MAPPWLCTWLLPFLLATAPGTAADVEDGPEACAGAESPELSLRQLRARRLNGTESASVDSFLKDGMRCASITAPENELCRESVEWAFEVGLKKHPDWYFVPLGTTSHVPLHMASLDDMQRLFFCGRAGDTATRCGLPPCHCSTPPCDRCGGAPPPPQLAKPFTRIKRFNVAGDPKNEFDVVQIPDQNMTHSCSNYVDDGTTVFSEDGKLVLKVSSACADGRCLNSGRVMSKDAFTYGIFTFSAKVPKCHSVWPALWLLPGSSKGDGRYGPWPCSGEIDVLETVNGDPHGAFNLVAGFGSTTGSCFDPSAVSCNACAPPQYCTSTTLADAAASHYFVEDVNCDANQNSWREHLFVLYWQPEVIAAFVDPELTYDASGHLTGIQAKKHSNGQASYKTYHRSTTPTWSAVQDYMGKCFPGRHSADAPFDIPMKIVLNIAVGGYGGAPCFWGGDACQAECGGAIGSKLILSDISVWQ